LQLQEGTERIASTVLAGRDFPEESVLRFPALTTSILLVLSCSTPAQDNSKVNIFGGYQFTHVALGHDINGFNLNGWNASLSGYLSRYFGVSADFSGNYGSPFGVSNKTYTYLIGPVARFSNRSKMTPFGHVLFGGAHLNASSLGIGGSDNAFSWAIGGGVDVYENSRFSVRLAQADWLRTQFADSTQSNFRCSGGVVLKF
jgi:Outer membrane protein beta-barrel domain